MSITDELREWVRGVFNVNTREALDAIADHIDAEHQKCIDAMWEDAKSHLSDESLTEQGWIRLPKDADGEYIHIGDEMEGVDKYDSLKKVMGKVITVSFESDGIVDVAIRAWNSDGKSWHRAYLDPDASIYRHHHAPTVEDVLQKLLEQAVGYSDAHTTVALNTIAEFAAKLRLAEWEEQ